MMTPEKEQPRTAIMPLNYGATYLCRKKCMIVSLGYCAHCGECRVNGGERRQLEKHPDVYA